MGGRLPTNGWGAAYQWEDPPNSRRNIQYWDEALTAARSHGDLYLEALTTKNMGIVSLTDYGYASAIMKYMQE